MRKFHYLFILIPLFISCSSDSREFESANNSVTESADSFGRTSSYPRNLANDYDISGQLYYRFTQEHLDANYDPSSMENIVNNIETISNLDTDYLLLKPMDYIVPDHVDLLFKYNNPITATQALDSVSISTLAKSKLIAFTDSIAVYRIPPVDFSLVYDYILDYESKVISDSIMTISDKKVILTFTSITRYGFYFADTHKRRKPRDKNWDLTLTGLVSGLEGGSQNTAKAITMSVIMGIASNRDY